jgi:hypothetical protein
MASFAEHVIRAARYHVLVVALAPGTRAHTGTAESTKVA